MGQRRDPPVTAGTNRSDAPCRLGAFQSGGQTAAVGATASNDDSLCMHFGRFGDPARHSQQSRCGHAGGVEIGDKAIDKVPKAYQSTEQS